MRKEKSQYKKDEKISMEELRKEIDMCNATCRMLKKKFSETETEEKTKSASHFTTIAVIFGLAAVAYGYYIFNNKEEQQ